jgi:hypothetical protein
MRQHLKVFLALAAVLWGLRAMAGTAPLPVIDGRISQCEWKGSQHYAMVGGGDVYLLRKSNALYVAVVGPEPGFPTLCVGNGSSVEVLHASAAQGSVRYVRRGSHWVSDAGQFVYFLRQDAQGNQAPPEARAAFFKSNGWVSISSRSHEQVREFRLRALPGRARIAIAFLAIPSMRTYHWPEGAGDGCLDLRLLQGHVPGRLNFRPSGWAGIAP